MSLGLVERADDSLGLPRHLDVLVSKESHLSPREDVQPTQQVAVGFRDDHSEDLISER